MTSPEEACSNQRLTRLRCYVCKLHSLPDFPVLSSRHRKPVHESSCGPWPATPGVSNWQAACGQLEFFWQPAELPRAKCQCGPTFIIYEYKSCARNRDCRCEAQVSAVTEGLKDIANDLRSQLKLSKKVFQQIQ